MEGDEMEVVVTNHAIKQYHRRNFGPEQTEGQIRKLMTNAAQKGKREDRKPPYNKSIYKVTYQGESAIIEYQQDKAIVLTYLGDKRLQGWYFKKEICPRTLMS